MKKKSSKKRPDISMLLNNESYHLKMASILLEKKHYRLVVIADDCKVLENRKFDGFKKIKMYFGYKYGSRAVNKNIKPSWSSVYDPKDVGADDRIDFLLEELNKGVKYISFMPLGLPTATAMEEVNKKLKPPHCRGCEIGSPYAEPVTVGFKRKFYHLTNHVYFFLGYVYILPCIDERFRLVVIHADMIWTDTLFSSLPAAKKAFLHLYEKRCWQKKVKPIWSEYCNHDLETIQKLIDSTYKNQKINRDLIKTLRLKRTKNRNARGTDWIPYSVFRRFIRLSELVSEGMS